MSDLSTDETVRNAFAKLRYDEPPHFAPPGADAARRTVRRRRVGGAAGAGAAVVALLSAGYLGVTGIDWSGSGGGQLPGAGWASVPPEQLVMGGDPVLTRLAADALRYDDPANPAVLGSIQELTPDTEDSFGWGPGVEGTFAVRISCAGQGGSVTVTVRAGENGGPRSATAHCGTTASEVSAGVGEAVIDVDESDDIEFDLTWTGTAEWGSGDDWPIVATTTTGR